MKLHEIEKEERFFHALKGLTPEAFEAIVRENIFPKLEHYRSLFTYGVGGYLNSTLLKPIAYDFLRLLSNYAANVQIPRQKYDDVTAAADITSDDFEVFLDLGYHGKSDAKITILFKPKDEKAIEFELDLRAGYFRKRNTK